MANTTAHELQVRYSNMLLARLRASTVTKDKVIFNTKYQGQPTAGAVKIPYRGEVSVRDYDMLNGLQPNSGQTKYLTVPINRMKAVNELIPGYVAAAVPDNLVADVLESAGYTLALDSDTTALTLLGNLDTATYDANDPRYGKKAATSTVGDSVFDTIVDARAEQTKKHVNPVGRYIIASAEGYALLLKDKDNFIKKGDLAQAIVQTGAVGMIAGYAVYESQNMPEGVLFILGHPDYATRILEWQSLPHVVDLEGDANYINTSAVKGLLIEEFAVTHPEAFHIIKSA